MVFVFGSVFVVYYVDRLAYIEPALHPWDEADLICWISFLMCFWIQFASISLKIFASMFIMDIGLKFFFYLSLSDFGIWEILVS